MDNNQTSIQLYEYTNKELFGGCLNSLDEFLNGIWRNRSTSSCLCDGAETENYEKQATNQKFVKLYRNDCIKACNYVGVIKIDGTTINILPKIFYDEKNPERSQEELNDIQANILWWLSYNRKLKFPKAKSQLGSFKNNFLEVLIHLFATYTREALSHCLYQAYSEFDKDLSYMKGRINVNRYINDHISKGNWHKLACIYEAFEFDNLFNRIIKYVSRILLGTSENKENKKLLSEILFLLDEVTDAKVDFKDCDKVKLNPLHNKLQTVLDYCRLFLSNSITFEYKEKFKVFAILLPMEKIFEDFIFGFIEKNLNDAFEMKNLKRQKSDLSLASLYENDILVHNNVFNLQHDIYFEYEGKKFVADTKYKLTYDAGIEPSGQEHKHGVSQADLYQMVSYAIRRDAKDVYLIYPQSISEQKDVSDNKSVKFLVQDEFAGKHINVHISKVPIIHAEFPNVVPEWSLNENFEETKSELRNKLCQTFGFF
jgi:5-methylcytosine-specific restriction enzyme subunit McrC